MQVNKRICRCYYKKCKRTVRKMNSRWKLETFDGSVFNDNQEKAAEETVEQRVVQAAEGIGKGDGVVGQEEGRKRNE